MRVKVEVNTFDRAPARDLQSVRYEVDSDWFSGSADVPIFSLPELVTTKLRALFQRSKGRDLFDLWLALTRLGVAPAEPVDAFGPYRPDGYTRRRAEQNLREKVADPAFRADLEPLVTNWPADYDIDTAADLVIRDVFGLL